MYLLPDGLWHVRRASRLAAVIAVSLGVTLSAQAAAQQARGDSACTLPTPAHDSVHVVVTAIATVDSSDRDRLVKLSPTFLAFVVEAVRTHFVPPTNLDLASLAGGMPHPPADWLAPPNWKAPRTTRTTPLLAADAYFTINASGTPGDIRIGHSSMAASLARSVDSAIRAIVPEDYGLVPQNADGVRVHFHLEAAPDSVATDQPFFTTWLPVYRIDQSPRAPKRPVIPTYPVNARDQGVTDTVLVSFAIGPSGRVIPGTIDLLSAHYRDFVDVVASTLRDNVFQPIIAEGCPVTSTVREAFTFELR